MAKKIGWLAIIWIGIIVTYILFAAVFPLVQSIVADTSANISGTYAAADFPGAQAGIDSAPLWLWFIPGLVGVISTIAILKKK